MSADSPDADLIQLIGGIYDAVIEPERWHDVCNRLRLRFDFHNAMLTLNGLPRGNMILNVTVNVPETFLSRIKPEHARDVIGMWGGPQWVAEYPLEEPAVMSEQGSPEAWTNFDYYNVFAVPQGIVDVVAIILMRDETAIGTIALGKHRSARALSRADIDQLRIIAPHLRRAVLVSGLLEDAVTRAGTFSAALDATSSGVVIVDAAGGIIHVNRAAEHQLEAGDPIRAEDGRLVLRSELVPGQLATAIRNAGNDVGLGRGGLAVPIRRADGSPGTVTVMPLEQRNLRGGVSSRATAAVFVSRVSAGALPSGALAALYDLTPAEERVFDLAVAGLTGAAIARKLGVSSSTVKTHMLRVFDKTGVRSRVGLANLANEMRRPD